MQSSLKLSWGESTYRYFKTRLKVLIINYRIDFNINQNYFFYK